MDVAVRRWKPKAKPKAKAARKPHKTAGKRGVAKPTKRATDEEVGAFLDKALADLGRVVGSMGYATPPPGPYPLPVPSGRLVVCDLAALPRSDRVGPVRRRGPDGLRTRGHILPTLRTTLHLYALCSLGDVDQWAIGLLSDRKALAARPFARIVPRSGWLLVADAGILPVLEGPVEPLPVAAREDEPTPLAVLRGRLEGRGVRMTALAWSLVRNSAATGLWIGRIAGHPAVLLQVGVKHGVWLRRGRDAEGQDVSLYMDAALDGVMADPVLRKIGLREMAAARRKRHRQTRTGQQS